VIAMNRFVLSILAFGLACTAALAQSTLSAEEIARQLKPAAPAATDPNAPRTRSLTRNLQVEKVAAPSVSLQIQFDFDSAKVSSQSRQALLNLALALKTDDLKTSRFLIEGHTDAKGKPEYNLRLSQQRANAVKTFLAAQAVGDARLQTEGKGQNEPANAADPLAPENRRVRIVNISE
jgi:outer membrane protein OmpA-like peptidoglycan-associated protein